MPCATCTSQLNRPPRSSLAIRKTRSNVPATSQNENKYQAGKNLPAETNCIPANPLPRLTHSQVYDTTPKKSGLAMGRLSGPSRAGPI